MYCIDVLDGEMFMYVEGGGEEKKNAGVELCSARMACSLLILPSPSRINLTQPNPATYNAGIHLGFGFPLERVLTPGALRESYESIARIPYTVPLYRHVT